MNSTGSVPEDTIRLEGFAPKDVFNRREKIFTRYAGGFFQRLRFFTGWPLLAAYFLLPWIQWAGQPAIAFDLSTPQIHVFSMTFFPDELWLLGWLVIIAAMGLITLTTLFGRAVLRLHLSADRVDGHLHVGRADRRRLKTAAHPSRSGSVVRG